MEDMEQTQLDHLFSELEVAASEAKAGRKILLDKIMSSVEHITLNPAGDKSTITEAKLAVLKMASDLMDAGEESIGKRIKIFLSRKDTEANINTQANVVAVLKEAAMQRFTAPAGVPGHGVDAALESTFQASGKEISAEELS